MSDSQVTYRVPASEQESAAYAGILRQTFAAEPDHIERWIGKVGRENTRVLLQGDEVVAGLVLYPMGQFFGGRSISNWGVAGVVVAVDWRARGAGSDLMRACLDEQHANGVALSGLYPATQPIYRRLGWELAGQRLIYELDPADIRVAAERAGDCRLRLATTSDLDTGRGLYERRARETSGNLDRNDTIWWRVSAEHGSPVYTYLVEGAAGPEGYVVFSQAGDAPKLELAVRDMVYHTPQAGCAILRLFANHRSMSNCVRFGGGPADPTAILLGEGVLKQYQRKDWMLRIVRAREALEERGYPVGLRASLEIELADEQLASNAGRFVLSIANGQGRIEPGGDGAYQLDSRGLAALYAGFRAPGDLRRAGQLSGGGEDAMLQAVFAGPSSWMPDFF